MIKAKARFFWTALPLAMAMLGGCKNDDAKREDNGAPPPPPAPSASGPNAKSNGCASGGGQVQDPQSSAFFPRTVTATGQAGASFCIDPQGNEKVYGDKEKFSMDQVCTTAFDGECEVYKRYGLKRVVALRYVDGAKPNSIELYLNQFKDAAGAFAMYTKRVAADSDPATTKMKPIAGAGGAAAQGGSNAYVWKGPYLIELTFNSDDPSMTRDQMAAASGTSCAAVGKAIAEKLPGTDAKLPAVAALPDASLVPLGVVYEPVDAVGLAGAGAAAIGFYKDGEKRWRDVAMTRDDADQAKDTMKALKSRPGALPVKDLGDEAVQLVVQTAKDAPKTEYVFARKGAMVAGVGDDEYVINPNEPLDKQAGVRLSKDEKLAKARAWLAAPAPSAAASGSATPSPSGSAGAPKPPASAAPKK